ncbi:unnamed protein product, partial [marine sediment metagenome]
CLSYVLVSGPIAFSTFEGHPWIIIQFLDFMISSNKNLFYKDFSYK